MCRLLTVEIVVLDYNIFLIQIHNNTYIMGFYHFMHVSYTFAEAELVKAALQSPILTIDFTPKRLASVHFCTSLLTSTCHKC